MTSPAAAGQREREAAQRVVDTYVDQRDNEDLPPAFDDIVFAESQRTGIDDDTLYHAAVALLFAQTGERIED